MPYVTFCNVCDPEHTCTCEPRNDTTTLTPQEFAKGDAGKLRYSLVPPAPLAEIARVLTFGANKYGANNWRKCDDPSRYIDAMMRHVEAYRQGPYCDSESGLNHMAHAICCAMFLMELE